MPTLQVVSFNVVCATLGGFIALFGLVSFLLKEKFYLSEALAGVIFSPHAANLIRPLEYALGNEETLGTITLYFTRLVLGVQLVIAGVQLPSKYLRKEWKSLAFLLGPGMVAMWLCTSLLVWAMVPNFHFVYALAVGACVTPTDPILSNSIVKGKFADKNVPKELQKIIIAESGTNDGLGYPFLFLPLFLIKFVMKDGAGSHGTAGTAVAMWFYETWVYEIILGVLYGAAVGWVAKELLHWAEERRYVDRESFIVFAIALALFIVGTCGMIGSDDVLACFIAGNTFTWDDWFRQETEDDTLQPTIDMLLNVTIFIWFGAVCPWRMFAHNNVIPIYRLVPLGILVLLFRRLPVVVLMRKQIHQIEGWSQTFFVGFFGPIGVSAIFYLYVTLEWLRLEINVDGEEREDAKMLAEVMTVVIWFLVICSSVVHGLSIPLGKLGFYIPRTLSLALSQDTNDPNPFHIQPTSSPATGSDSPITQSPLHSPMHSHDGLSAPRRMFRIGGTIISRGSAPSSKPVSKHGSRHVTPRTSRPVSPGGPDSEVPNKPTGDPSANNTSSHSTQLGNTEELPKIMRTPSEFVAARSIRFPDEQRPSLPKKETDV
ncbi:hypothetical protein EJ06DRAFT_482205 [Trichodelitschia bisporula]|uniref:Cation/H+ exchanger transmembrane domain-containing protein n=1 Tax=Trichodelitschia bisporula TaxID=703511 RepID=A0A6G1HMC2_9PEZI|nr:hypothetical protein EJ06DRAFT_482205 [Trichodelitschia bisporula]